MLSINKLASITNQPDKNPLEIISNSPKEKTKTHNDSNSKNTPVIKPQKPEIFIFDTYDKRAEFLIPGESDPRKNNSVCDFSDINGDGKMDVCHGEVMTEVVTKITKTNPNLVEVKNQSTVIQLNALLKRKNVSNIYMNFSNSAGSTREVWDKIALLAERGAHVFVASGVLQGGRYLLNPLAHYLKSKPNVYVVVDERTKSIMNVESFANRSSSGILNLNGEIPSKLIKPIEHNSSGQLLSQVDKTRLIYNSEHSGLKGFPAGSVASFAELKKVYPKLFNELVLEHLEQTTGKKASELDTLFVDLNEVRTFAKTQTREGGFVLYSVSANQTLQLVPQNELSSSSVASARALAEAVNQRSSPK